MRKRICLVMCFLALSVFAFGCGSDASSSDAGKTTGGNDTPGENGNEGGNDKSPECSVPDEDGDTISDEFEGRAENIDTDKDGIPDYRDDDSDNDGIPDKIEAGTNGCSGSEPGDADGDGIPDFQDTDSDRNGILDKDEVGPDPLHPIDSDNDTIPDYLDNDGDGIDDFTEIYGENNGAVPSIGYEYFYGDCDSDGQPDLKGTLDDPVDCDGDGVPDYMDDDSDGDTIPDKIEGTSMVGDWLGRYQKDSDRNGISDAEECGASNVEDLKDCIDTDGDTVPDVFDVDNDGDGLSDADELNKYHTDANKADSDDDGVADYVEIAIGTNASDAADNPQANGNFVFIAPYEGETTPKKQSLSFETAVQSVDMFFAFDQSESMSDEVFSLKSSLQEMLEKLQCKDYGTACNDNNDCAAHPNSICSEKKKCIQSPGYGDGCFDSMYTGVGFYHKFNSFWVGSHLKEGYSDTVDFLTKMFTDSNPNSFHAYGDDEAAYQAAICAAYGPEKDTKLCAQRSEFKNQCDGTVYTNCQMNCTTDESRVGCVGYRPDSIRLFIQAFDENQCYAHGHGNTIPGCNQYKDNIGSVMNEYKMRYVGLYEVAANYSNGGNDGGVKVEDVAIDIGKKSNSLSESGEAFVYLAEDEELADKAAQGIKEIAKYMFLEVTSEVEDIDKDASKLVEKLVVNVAGNEVVQNRNCAVIDNTITKNGKTEGISRLKPGTVVCYDVIPVESQSIFPAKAEPQLLKARVKVKGDESTLNSGVAYFVVPPVIPEEMEIN